MNLLLSPRGHVSSGGQPTGYRYSEHCKEYTKTFNTIQQPTQSQVNEYMRCGGDIDHAWEIILPVLGFLALCFVFSIVWKDKWQ